MLAFLQLRFDHLLQQTLPWVRKNIILCLTVIAFHADQDLVLLLLSGAFVFLLKAMDHLGAAHFEYAHCGCRHSLELVADTKRLIQVMLCDVARKERTAEAKEKFVKHSN